ncbi:MULTISPECIES: YceI family protein [Paenibacillus]|uniref:YceI family protein n=1 Tax=Paenibacillus agri TaxID=2744309 RepID=A0A850EU91_9BACL|nr:YceI family protein [Paenibacillus agri]NUU63420.1 YceI family protein [Paenibacillus agri]
MKKKSLLILVGVVIVAGSITGYTLLNKSLGNKIAIESVIPATGQNNSNSGSGTAEAAQGQAPGAAVTAEQLNGEWKIADTSKVYWSVTTSQETVNFVDKKVQGSWNVNLDDNTAMTGQGTVDMNALDSGNAQRDEHVKSGDFLSVAEHPESTFTVKSFSKLPAEWSEGKPVPVEMKGTLTVKGIEKDVTFQTQAVYSKGQLLLSGTTTVTFGDFGLSNPHTIVLSTENNLDVRLELVLNK